MTSKGGPETHTLLIMDRSAKGLEAADELLENCPQADERLSSWRASGDGFFVFILEQESGRIGSMSAEDLDQLLSDTLPNLFETVLMPPANPGFGVAADETICWAIYQTVEQLRATATGPTHSRQ
jgi:hypothetical protein